MPKMVFIERDGNRKEVEAPVGLSVLEIAHRNEVDIEGACEGSLACSTCHVIVDPDWHERLPEASEDEVWLSSESGVSVNGSFADAESDGDASWMLEVSDSS